MATFRIKLIWALAILAVGTVNAASPMLAPAMAPLSGRSPAKTVSPAPVKSTTKGVSQAPMMSPPMAMSPATSMTPASPPGPDCMTLVYNMSDCLTYVEQGSNATKPDKNCCPEVAGMLDSNPICLCTLLGKSSDLPIALDVNRALKLPSACRLDTPPVSLCSMVGIPIAAPGPGTAVSAESPSSTSGMAPGPMGMGEAAGPSGGKNGGATLNSYSNLPYVMCALALAVFTL